MYLWNGHPVSFVFLNLLDFVATKELSLMKLRICVISAFRAAINAEKRFMESDFPSYAGVTVLLATLEITLSIVSACLPLLQPVLSIISSKVKSTFTRTSNAALKGRQQWSSKQTQRNFRFPGSEGAQFKRLHDRLYPLSATGTTQFSYGDVTENHIRGPGESERSATELDDLSQSRQVQTSQPHNAISVTKMWNVSSSSPV